MWKYDAVRHYYDTLSLITIQPLARCIIDKSDTYYMLIDRVTWYLLSLTVVRVLTTTAVFLYIPNVQSATVWETIHISNTVFCCWAESSARLHTAMSYNVITYQASVFTNETNVFIIWQLTAYWSLTIYMVKETQ